MDGLRSLFYRSAFYESPLEENAQLILGNADNDSSEEQSEPQEQMHSVRTNPVQELVKNCPLDCGHRYQEMSSRFEIRKPCTYHLYIWRQTMNPRSKNNPEDPQVIVQAGR